MAHSDPYSARRILDTPIGSFTYYRIDVLKTQGIAPHLDRLPFSIQILLESLLRNFDGFAITEQDIRRLAQWSAQGPNPGEIPFKPARVILQDFTGVPLLVDLAAMRAAVKKVGGDPRKINPLVPVDLVIDHSVQVDYYGTSDALLHNAKVEFRRNKERYEFLRWGQNAVDNFNVVPPSTGIVHQVNLEYLAPGVVIGSRKGSATLPPEKLVYPDTLVGTDSHTTMINGLGVLGWGVGGIEAEAVMLGQPLFMLTPQVVGFKLFGALPEGVTATDLTLTITQILRKRGVVDKFVEFCGSGLSTLSLADRATIANMAPEYGATLSFFPVDDLTIDYLRRTGRPKERVDLCERYYKEQGLFRTDTTPDPLFTEVIELDLATVEPSLAGPKRPQDRIPLSQMKPSFRSALRAPLKDRGFALAESDEARTAQVKLNPPAPPVTLQQGAVVIAAITSCTNTSNPSVMLAAGLLAKKAVEAGLKVPSYVKTSLAPGSKVVTEYLVASGLLPYLEQLGFYLVGYGCTTCIGNSGPLLDPIETAITQENLVVSAVLSGNRNFEGRIHPLVRANYLASPPLVVAYALAGTVDIELQKEPIGLGKDQKPVYLREVWPSQEEIESVMQSCISPEMFSKTYAAVYQGSEEWNSITGVSGDLYHFHPESTYIQEPPFFQELALTPPKVSSIQRARVLCLLGDSITTDHISPAGNISADSPAGLYLREHGVQKADFNSYGARRGNDRVMVRGTFANVRLKNLLIPGVEGGITTHLPTLEQMSIFDAAKRYKTEGVPLIVIAGKEYGSGSSRDWAAKGTLLLGVRAVLAESFERIHRSNLVGMGILPLVFKPGETAESLGLIGRERYSIEIPEDLSPKQELSILVEREGGSSITFQAISRLDSPIEVRYYQNGGILHAVLRELLKK